MLKRLLPLGFLALITNTAMGETVSGRPITRGNDLFDPVGCQFRCPAGAVQIDSVEFFYRNGTDFGPRGWQEHRVDGGVLICFGERRTVGKATIPEIPFGIIEIPRCRVNFHRIVEIGDDRSCNQRQLDLCLQYGGGDACYEKWCD